MAHRDAALPHFSDAPEGKPCKIGIHAGSPGRATGDERLEAEGVADQAAGKVQKGVGNIKEAARDALKH